MVYEKIDFFQTIDNWIRDIILNKVRPFKDRNLTNHTTNTIYLLPTKSLLKEMCITHTRIIVSRYMVYKYLQIVYSVRIIIIYCLWNLVLTGRTDGSWQRLSPRGIPVFVQSVGGTCDPHARVQHKGTATRCRRCQCSKVAHQA